MEKKIDIDIHGRDHYVRYEANETLCPFCFKPCDAYEKDDSRKTVLRFHRCERCGERFKSVEFKKA